MGSPSKKSKAKHQVLSDIFKFTTPKEVTMSERLVQAVDAVPTTLKLEAGPQSTKFPYLSTNHHIDKLISSHSLSSSVEVLLILFEEQVSNDDYLRNCLQYSRYYKNLFVYDSYEEINEEQFKLLNTDWESSPFSVKIAAGRMLGYGILVDG